MYRGGLGYMRYSISDTAEYGDYTAGPRIVDANTRDAMVATNTELDTGDVLQFTLVTEKYITFLSEVTPEYYILLVLQPDGNYGRARFELSKAKHLLRDELV